MPMKKGTWHQCPIHASKAGKIGATKSPWRKPCPPELKKALDAERIARLQNNQL